MMIRGSLGATAPLIGMELAVTALCVLAALWWPVFLMISAVAATAIWAKTFVVIIDGDRLVYVAPLRRRRSVSVRSIQSATCEVGFSRYRDRFTRPPVRLAIHPIPSSGCKPLDVNLKPFRRGDVQRLLTAIGALD